MNSLTKPRTIGILVFFLTLLMVVFAYAQEKKSPATARKTTPAATNSQVARGKYIVEEVAKCGNCHTPRDANGNPDQMHPLSGAPTFFRPAQPMPDWPIVCPRIGGTPPAPDADMVTLLTTGVWPKTGQPLRQPMPQFHMTREDAEAVVAYLKSLGH